MNHLMRSREEIEKIKIGAWNLAKNSQDAQVGAVLSNLAVTDALLEVSLDIRALLAEIAENTKPKSRRVITTEKVLTPEEEQRIDSVIQA